MIKSFADRLATLTILAVTLVASAQAAEIESVIPAYSASYAVIRDVPGIWNAMGSSTSWQAFLSYDVIKDRVQAIGNSIKWLSETCGVDPVKLSGIFGSRLALVKIYPDVSAFSFPVIISDVGDSGNGPEIIRKIEQALSNNEEYDVKSLADTYKSVPLGLVRHSGGEIILRYAFLDNLLVFATEKGSFEEVIDTSLGEIPALIYDPKFNRTRAEVSAEGGIFIYVNAEVLWPTVMRSLKTFSQVLDVCGVKSIAWSIDLLNPAGLQEMYIYTGGENGLLNLIFTEPKQLDAPHLIPASDSDIFFSIHLGDLETLWESVRGYSGEGIVSNFERDTGLSLKSDILASLTGEIGFAIPLMEFVKFLDKSRSLLEAGFMIFCGVSDRELCARSIDKVLAAVNIKPQLMEYRGATIHLIPVLSSQEIPVGYMFAGDMLILGNFQKLWDLIEEQPPLVVSEKFISLQLPQQSGFLYYMDLWRLGELSLRSALTAKSGEDISRSQTAGSIGGTVISGEGGLKIRSASTFETTWIEVIGCLVNLSILALANQT